MKKCKYWYKVVSDCFSNKTDSRYLWNYMYYLTLKTIYPDIYMIIMLNKISTCFRMLDDFLQYSFSHNISYITYVLCTSKGKAQKRKRTVLQRALWRRNVVYLFEWLKIQTVILMRNSKWYHFGETFKQKQLSSSAGCFMKTFKMPAKITDRCVGWRKLYKNTHL